VPDRRKVAMYTRRSRFPLKPDNTDKAEAIGLKYGTLLHALPGHVSTVMFVDDDSFMSITTWDTEEHAEAVKSTRDDAQRDLADILSGAPTTSIERTLVHDVR
jgi:hypothetical protein